jgi:hypothetical protein
MNNSLIKNVDKSIKHRKEVESLCENLDDTNPFKDQLRYMINNSSKND